MKTILVVDDELKIVKLVRDYLEQAGPPDLILMDVRLRGQMNGYEVIAKIRQHSNIPVIYLTGGDQFQIDEKAKNTKPYDYIVKPFDIEVLEKKIRKLLEEQCNSLKAAHAKTA